MSLVTSNLLQSKNTVNTKNLLPGTYNGIEFFYRGETVKSGQKTVTHTFPGSDNSFDEQLGNMPRIFTIEMHVRLNNRDALDNALSTTGNGFLTLPTYKGIFIVKPINGIQKSHAINKLGLYEYTVSFSEQVGIVIPTISTVTKAFISDLARTTADIATVDLKAKLLELGI